MIAIIDYNAGNLTSVRLAFESLGRDAEITQSAEEILAAERVVFPGVGAAGAAMQNLNDLGLVDVITEIAGRGTPFLGICLGTQIVFGRLDEDGGVDGVGLFAGTVKRFAPDSPYDKVPQMGWNAVSLRRPHPLFEGIEDDSEFYFVHSYYPAPEDLSCVLGETGYAGVRFASVVVSDNVVATQFHPEKSGRVGLSLLDNFCRWDGKERETPC
jgi:imidazole glycerol-phosphate synthase subunit HisH